MSIFIIVTFAILALVVIIHFIKIENVNFYTKIHGKLNTGALYVDKLIRFKSRYKH